MGALHEGHLNLIRKSKQQAELTVCSIFVNPTQFNDPKDYQNYPITLESDLEKLALENCDIVFTPTVDEIYPSGINELPHYQIGQLENLLEGAHRPGHFQGVCQIVNLLLNTVKPTYLYMGEKDFQQVAVIKQLLKNLNHPIQLVACPTVRASNGLALSSRNSRLTAEQFHKAASIYSSFDLMNEKAIEQHLRNNGFESIDYIACVDSETLEPKPFRQKPCTLLIAATIGGVRLIDNKTYL
jgi:pantoate--beta-alanine ligase